MNNVNTIVQSRAGWFRQVWAFARRHIQKLIRSRTILFLSVPLPVIWYLLTMELFISGSEEAAVQLGVLKATLGLAYGMFGAFIITVAVFAGEFARDLDDGRYRKFRSLGISPTADLAGRFCAGAAIGVASYTVTVVFAALYGASFPTPDGRTIGVVVLTVGLFCLIAMTLAMMLALIVPKAEHMTLIAFLLVVIAFALTGYNGMLPEIARNSEFMNYLPNSLATRLQISVWFGNAEYLTPPALPDLVGSLGLLLGTGIVLVALSGVLMQQLVYKKD